MVYWSRSRQEVWRKGDTSGDRQFVREAYYDCDGDALLFLVDQDGGGRVPHRRALVLLPPLRRDRERPDDDRAWTRLPAESPRSSTRWPPTTRSCRCGPNCSATSRRRSRPTPSWSVTAPGFLLESVEHGERWSRFSFVGRDPSATLMLRNGRITVDGAVPASVPRDRGMLGGARCAAPGLPRRR